MRASGVLVICSLVCGLWSRSAPAEPEGGAKECVEPTDDEKLGNLSACAPLINETVASLLGNPGKLSIYERDCSCHPMVRYVRAVEFENEGEIDEALMVLEQISYDEYQVPNCSDDEKKKVGSFEWVVTHVCEAKKHRNSLANKRSFAPMPRLSPADRQHQEAALAAARADRWDAAYREFTAIQAHETGVDYNRFYAALRSGRYTEAWVGFSKLLDAADLTDWLKEHAMKGHDEANQHVAFLTPQQIPQKTKLRIAVPTFTQMEEGSEWVRADSRTDLLAAAKLMVPVGRWTFSAEVPGSPDEIHQPMDVGAGSRSFTLRDARGEHAREDHSTAHTLEWVGGGAAVLGAGLFLGGWAMRSDAVDGCPNLRCPDQSRLDAVDAASALLISGTVFAAAGLTLFGAAALDPFGVGKSRGPSGPDWRFELVPIPRTQGAGNRSLGRF